jgi:hypothetical protein
MASYCLRPSESGRSRCGTANFQMELLPHNDRSLIKLELFPSPGENEGDEHKSINNWEYQDHLEPPHISSANEGLLLLRWRPLLVRRTRVARRAPPPPAWPAFTLNGAKQLRSYTDGILHWRMQIGYDDFEPTSTLFNQTKSNLRRSNWTLSHFWPTKGKRLSNTQKRNMTILSYALVVSRLT